MCVCMYVCMGEYLRSVVEDEDDMRADLLNEVCVCLCLCLSVCVCVCVCVCL